MKTKFYDYIKKAALLSLRLSGDHPIHTAWSGIGTIFTLHRIIENETKLSNFNSILEISVDSLERHLNYLKKKKYDFLSIEDLPDRLKYKKIKSKFVIFTFADGYSDNYELALPVFEAYKIPFTVYIFNSLPKNAIVLCWYMLEDILFKNNYFEFENNSESYKFELKTNQQKAYCFNFIRNFILQSTPEIQKDKISSVFKTQIPDLTQKTKDLSLTWAQVKLLDQSQYATIGVHTLHHYSLKDLSKEDLYTEIKESKTELETFLEHSIHHFAYPFGSKVEVSPREVEVVRQLGFETATTTLIGNIYEKHQNLTLELPRIFLCESINKFALNVRLNGIYPVLSNQGRKINNF